MSFLEVLGNVVHIQGIDRKYEIKPLTLKSWRNFVVWVQYKPFRDAKIAQLDKESCDKILLECQRGIVVERVLPTDWPEGKEATVADLVEQEVEINAISSVVIDCFTSLEGFEFAVEQALYQEYPELVGKCFYDLIPETSKELEDELIELRKEVVRMNGFGDLLKKDEENEDTPKNEQSPNEV